jgi:arylsulfatase A
MFAEYISNFIDSNLHNPFFVYFPLSLCHDPFSPTPDDPEFAVWDPLEDGRDTAFFPSMVKYMDKKVKQIVDKINSVGLASRTIIIFMGDNGTPNQISSTFKGERLQGGKNTSTTHGIHVPLIVTCPAKFLSGLTSAGLIDASDFLPTLADMTKINEPKTMAL